MYVSNIYFFHLSSECQCFGHADSCVYDANVEATGRSLDILNNVAGGGVCQSCRDNTAGN